MGEEVSSRRRHSALRILQGVEEEGGRGEGGEGRRGERRRRRREEGNTEERSSCTETTAVTNTPTSPPLT